MVKLYFAEYLPDKPDLDNNGITLAKNVIPSGSSYLQFPALTAYSSNALDAYCRGAVSAKDSDGSTSNFFGTGTKLYNLVGGAFNDISIASGYNSGLESMWNFAQTGERIMATNFDDYIQSYVMGSSALFANLTTALRARYIATMSGFVLTLNTWDSSDGNVPERLRWCARGDATDWTVSSTTQAGYANLDGSKGWGMNVIGGEYSIAFQERAITRIQYVGSPNVFQLDEIESGRGLLAPSSAIKAGNLIFYLGQDGFYVTDGNSSIPIGENKINRTFFAEVDNAYYQRISSAVDINKQVIYWAYPASGNTSGRPNKILMYNFAPEATTRWAFAEVDIDVIFPSFSEGYTLDNLDTFSTNIDTLEISLDSRFYTGNQTILSGINSDQKLAYFNGSALVATIETTEAQLIEGSRAFVKLLRTLVHGTTATTTVAMGTRNNLDESVTWGNAISANSNGEYFTRSNARYHRARVSISGGFDHAQGIEVLDYSDAGKR